MIQRVQSLLLLGAFVCFVLGSVMPIGTLTTSSASYIYDSWTVSQNTPDGGIVFKTFYIGILQIALAVMCLITIFLYKQRMKQSKFCIACIVLNFILLILMLYLYPDVWFQKVIAFSGAKLVYNPWCITSILSVAFFYIANKLILNDEKKVRAADRLR